MNRPFAPLIIIGMHRSGTSLLAEKLHLAGVFMGGDQGKSHSESRLFLRLNQFVYAAAHAEWDNPLPVCWMLEDEALSEAIVEELSRRCDAEKSHEFLGQHKTKEVQLPQELPCVWGWKDPRNTFTLPLWLRIYPDARVLNVVRNGVDVANSLVVRENKRRLRLDSSARSCRCLTLERSFELWTEYVGMAEHVFKGLGEDRVLSISYESFLEQPIELLGKIARFAGLDTDESSLQAITKDIDCTRAFAFQKDDALNGFYENCARHPLMIRHGYSRIGREDSSETQSLNVSSSHGPMSVEVILPTYESGTWLDEAIESVFDQTYRNWHLTLVDDASSTSLDRQEKWCEKYPEHCSVIRRSQCGGAAAARMDAVRRTGADVLTFLDQDDRWLPEKLKLQVEYFQSRPDVAAVHTGIEMIDDIGALMPGAADRENAKRLEVPYDELSKEDLAISLFSRNSIRIISSAVRRVAFVDVGGFDVTLFGGEDWEFWVRLADSHRIGYISTPLIQRRIHEMNTSKVQRYRRCSGQFKALRKMKQAYPYLHSRVDNKRMQLVKKMRDTASSNGLNYRAQLHAIHLRALELGIPL